MRILRQADYDIIKDEHNKLREDPDRRVRNPYTIVYDRVCLTWGYSSK